MTRNRRRSWITEFWIDYSSKFNQKALKDFRIAKAFSIKTKLSQDVLKRNDVVDLLRWVSRIADSSSERSETSDDQNFHRTSISIVEYRAEDVIDLQEVVDESRKLIDLVEDWRQNELQMTCCESLSADLIVKIFRSTKVFDKLLVQ